MTCHTSEQLPALGICLEEYEYPYPVRFLPVTNDLQSSSASPDPRPRHQLVPEPQGLSPCRTLRFVR
jgi:hypothetical protein